MSNPGKRGNQDLAHGDWIGELEKASGMKYEGSQLHGTTVLAIDCSGSMDGEKIAKAKKGALGYIRTATSRGFSIGIVKFSSIAEIIVDPLKSNRDFNLQIERVNASGSTNMAEGLLLSVKLLERTIGKRTICLVTDGMPDNRDATLSAAKRAKEKGIEIITIGTDDADGAFLAELASSQKHSYKVDSDKLDEVIAAAARLLPTGK